MAMNNMGRDWQGRNGIGILTRLQRVPAERWVPQYTRSATERSLATPATVRKCDPFQAQLPALMSETYRTVRPAELPALARMVAARANALAVRY
jgi:hypothetical protein